MIGRGEKVTVLGLPNSLVPNRSILPNGVQRIDLQEVSDQAIGNLFAQNPTLQVGSFIHLHPTFPISAEAESTITQFFAQEKQIIKTVFFLAKHLTKPLNEFGQKYKRANFLIINRLDGNLGTRNTEFSPVAGGLFGLAKCLKLEWTAVFSRAVDISNQFDVRTTTNLIINELHDPNRKIAEVGISPEMRSTLLTEYNHIVENQSLSSEINNNSVFLVSGGARGVTADCVLQMAKTYQSKFILLGRSALQNTEPDWAKNISAEADLKKAAMQAFLAKGEKPTPKILQKAVGEVFAQREIKGNLQKIQDLGGKAVYVSCDVMKIDSIKTMLNSLSPDFQQITGFIHGAGVLADKYIKDKAEADFEAVYSTKIDGLANILECLKLNELRQMVFFSSVAGFYGNFGQSDYSIANEILTKTAYLFRKKYPNCHVVSVNWGAWDSGMVSPELKKMFENQGVRLIPNEAGANMLVNELTTGNQNVSQIIVGELFPYSQTHISANLEKFAIDRKLRLAENPFLNDHVINGNPVLPIVNAISWIAESAEQLYPAYKIVQVADTKLFKGLVFDGKQSEDYRLELQEMAKNAEEIVFEGKISSTENGKLRFHYSARVHLATKKSAQPEFKVDTQNVAHIEGGTLYQDHTLFHGRYFQGIRKVLKMTENQIVMECNMENVPAEAQGQFVVSRTNGFLTDVMYQSLVVWVRKMRGTASLPLKTKAVTIYETVRFEQKYYVTALIRECTDFKAIADMIVTDENHRVVMETEGAEVTLSKDLNW